MRRQRLNSTSIRSAGYDEFSQDLEVEFANGKIYRYHDVPYELYVSFKRASSKGRFINWRIKNTFPYTEMENRNDVNRRYRATGINEESRR